MASARPGNRVTANVPTKLIQCPRCLQPDGRIVDGQRSVCSLCSKSLRRIYQFCWACRREWPRTGSLAQGCSCSLPGCGKRAALLSGEIILNTASAAFMCPFFRACPHCTALVTHDGVGCRYITCPNCGTEFCFRCLRNECDLEGEGLDFYEDEDEDEDEDGIEPCVIVDNSAALQSL